jgi:hypothetical protein
VTIEVLAIHPAAIFGQAGARRKGTRQNSRMKLGSVDVLVRALDSAGVRYLVAGGLAVNAHGYLRFTRDIDIVLHLSPPRRKA